MPPSGLGRRTLLWSYVFSTIGPGVRGSPVDPIYAGPGTVVNDTTDMVAVALGVISPGFVHF